MEIVEVAVREFLIMLTAGEKQYLKKIYYNPRHKAGYGSVKSLYDAVVEEGRENITKKEVKQFLESLEVYTTHVSKKRAKYWSSMITPGPQYMADVDSAVLNVGGGHSKYFIVGVDNFSRKAAAEKVDNLTAKVVNKALGKILDTLKVQRVRFDGGSEYNNSTVYSTLKRKRIKYIVSTPPYKSSQAEILIKHFKRKLYMILQKKGEQDWSPYLQKIVAAYNEKPHRMLGLSPNQVTKQNVPDLWFRFKNEHLKHMPPPTPYRYELNDTVRVNYSRQNFAKNYEEQNSTMIYFISSRYSRSNVHRYTVKDQRNDPLRGSFTQPQLQLTRDIGEHTVYRIEEVLHYKRINGQLQAYIKWQNYSSKFNSYIPAADVVTLRHQE